MPIRIESKDRLTVGDRLERDDGTFVVTETTIWFDAADNYAYTEAMLEPVGGDGGPGPD
ncbi:hypothetical protein J7I84_08855 [Arthrobacter sp. ISL-85]|uniref:hypothetical protein n=1 Tax=Arthrobacter sp. ISL-85 TaxID=2819115 RepID=UPI001BEAFAA6|nr:hypothetical protein [Arthrobacter sp. ISL-85]MBT2566601.1 hypothetical protein [Arthrobacter sp. ISL-85]